MLRTHQKPWFAAKNGSAIFCPNGNFFAYRIFLRSYHVLQYFLACRSLAGAGCSHTNRCGFVVGATGRMKHGQLTEQEDSEDAARASVTPVASWKRCTSWEPSGPARVRTSCSKAIRTDTVDAKPPTDVQEGQQPRHPHGDEADMEGHGGPRHRMGLKSPSPPAVTEALQEAHPAAMTAWRAGREAASGRRSGWRGE